MISLSQSLGFVPGRSFENIRDAFQGGRYPNAELLTKQELADAGLVSAVSSGKPGAEQHLVMRFRPSVHSLLMSLVKDTNLAEDLVQETLMLTIEKLRAGCIRKPHKLTSYIFSTAKFTYFGWLRKKDNQVELIDSAGECPCDSATPEEACMVEEEWTRMVSHISQLKMARDREILIRRYIKEESKEEICQAMVLSVDHYDRVISRARQRLKCCVNS